MASTGIPTRPEAVAEPDEREGLADLFRELRSGPEGLDTREAERRQLVFGPNAR